MLDSAVIVGSPVRFAVINVELPMDLDFESILLILLLPYS